MAVLLIDHTINSMLRHMAGVSHGGHLEVGRVRPTRGGAAGAPHSAGLTAVILQHAYILPLV